MSVDVSTLAIEVKSDGVPVATDRLKNLTAEGGRAEAGNGRLSSSFGSLAGYIKAAALALGLMKLVDYIRDAVLLSARYETLGAAMNVVGNNAGYTAKQMAAYQEKLQATGIAMIEARESLTKMASAQMDMSKSSELARIAQDAAVIGNINSSEAFGRMIDGIQRGETEILKTIGINVQFEAGYQKLAATLGKTSKELTEAEKVTARTNAVMERGTTIAGAYEAAMGTAGKQINSMKRYMDNLKVILGATFNDALIIAVSGFTDGLKDANTEAEKLQREGALKAWGRDLVMTFAGVADAIKLVLLTISTFTGAIVAGMMQAYSIGMAITKLSRGDFKGAGESMKAVASYGSGYIEDMKKRWSAETYTSMATGMYASRDANAAGDAAKAEALEKQRIAAAKAAKAEDAARQATAAAGSKSGKSDSLPGMYTLMTEELDSFSNKMASWWTDEEAARTEAAEAAKTALDAQRQQQEAQIQYNLSLVDTKEAFHQITQAEAAEQRLALNKELLDSQEKWLASMVKATDPAGWLQQAQAIEQTRQGIVALKKAVQSYNGSASAGWQEGIKKYKTTLPPTFQQMSDMAEGTAQSMQGSFKSVFSDGLKGDLKSLSGYFSSFMDSLLDMWANTMAQMTMSSMMGKSGGWGDLFGSLFGGGLSNGGKSYNGIDYSWAFEGLQGYATGTDYVPRTGPYILHQGEKVVTAQDNAKNNQNVSISVPISIENGSKALVSDMRKEMEETAIRVLRRHS